MSTESRIEEVLKLVEEAGVLRPRDLRDHGIAATYLYRLLQRGLVQRVGWGLYTLPGAVLTEHHSLAEACKRVPRGVVCLLTALRFHGLTTQNPHEIWMAVEQKAWRPKRGSFPLHLIFISGPPFTEGIEMHDVKGVRVPVYNAAKTVADCFRFRNKIGLDVAIEALRDYLRLHPRDVNDLWQHAKVCRVTAVMRPLLEALA